MAIVIFGVAALFLIVVRVLLPISSYSNLGRISTIEECETFEDRVVQERSATGLNITSKNVVAADQRCYVEIGLRVPKGRLHAVIIDDGESGIDIARCTVEADHGPATCTDSLDTVQTYGDYETIRLGIFGDR